MKELTDAEAQSLRSKYELETGDLAKVLPHIEIEEISDDQLHKNVLSFKCPFFGYHGCEYQLLQLKGNAKELDLIKIAVVAHIFTAHT